MATNELLITVQNEYIHFTNARTMLNVRLLDIIYSRVKEIKADNSSITITVDSLVINDAFNISTKPDYFSENLKIDKLVYKNDLLYCISVERDGIDTVLLPLDNMPTDDLYNIVNILYNVDRYEYNCIDLDFSDNNNDVILEGGYDG